MPTMKFTTRILAGGKELPMTPEHFENGDICALDGVSITWGKTNQVDQPEPALARFALASKNTNQSQGEAFAVGTPIQIFTRGTVKTDPANATSNILETTRHRKGDLTLVSANPETWQHLPKKTWESELMIYPAEAGDPNDPGAWDKIRKAEGGTWKIRVAGNAPDGAQITLTFLTWQLHTLPPELGETHTYNVSGPFDLVFESVIASGWVGAKIETKLAYQRTWQQTPGAWSDHQEAWNTHTPDNLTYTPTITSQAFTQSREVMVFQGSVTDASSVIDPTGLKISVIAGDLLAELGSIPITGTARPNEPVNTRIKTLVGLTGITPAPETVLPSNGQTVIYQQQLENTKALPVLHECAWATGTNLYVRSHPVSGQVIVFEKPTERAKSSVSLPAGLFQEKGVQLTQDLTDATTTVTVWYQDGENEAAITLRDDSALHQGERNTEVKTLLTTKGDASLLAADWLDRVSRAPAWRVKGLVWSSITGGNDNSFEPALDILSAHTRNGLPIHLTGLPAWLPAETMNGWLEGGTYEFRKNTWNLQTNFTIKEG
ncbi:hypothetical protein [uncultured Mobiluncus sp.]|uniref:hypothetical protein n=1 Tax=uncultured Mobiluncus sp. TaxID=293425 RepID=UPI0025CBB7AD|nr:hypothetical protein [uncultured Mobiluncus sp.]